MSLKSWVVEGSLDSRCWTEIDGKTDIQDLTPQGREIFRCFFEPPVASFAVSNPVECRIIRLSQVNDGLQLVLFRVEFFGTLSE
jgi:hypothetical protein